MKLPHGMTEPQVIRAIEHAVDRLCPGFVFGYYDLDDIRQQARLFALEAIARYDATPDASGLPRPLENFIYRHVQNRLINFKRDKHHRHNPPCLLCARAGSAEYAHPGTGFCKSFLDWRRRNASKANLLVPNRLTASSDNLQAAPDTTEDVATREITQLIDRELPASLRENYLKMRVGARVPRSARLSVEKAVKSILEASHAPIQ